MYKKAISEHSYKIQIGDTFDVGHKVKKSGLYICVPCGYTCTFKKGDTLPRCFNCLVNKKYNGDDYIKDLGLWEFLK